MKTSVSGPFGFSVDVGEFRRGCGKQTSVTIEIKRGCVREGRWIHSAMYVNGVEMSGSIQMGDGEQFRCVMETVEDKAPVRPSVQHRLIGEDFGGGRE